MNAPNARSPTPPEDRRRGRPRKDVHADNSVAASRRKRNRQAQRLLKARKEAQQELVGARISSLEDSLDRMSNVIITFADKILGSQAALHDNVLLRDAELLLRQSLQIVSAERLPDAQIKMVTAGEVDARATVGPSEFDVSVMSALHTGCELNHDKSLSSTDVSLPDAMELMKAALSKSSLEPRIPISSVYGNGWTGDLPIPFQSQQTNEARPLNTATALSIRIVHTSLVNAYNILVTAGLDDPVVFERFGFALKYHTREMILYSIRWFLGPGMKEMSALTNYRREFLPWIRSTGLIDEEIFDQLPHAHNPELDYFLTADEVSSFLISRGAIDSEHEIFNLWIGGGGDGVHQDHHSETRNGRFDFSDADVFFPRPNASKSSCLSHDETLSMNSSQSSRPVRVSQALFLQNLGDISTCLIYGPAFRAERLLEIVMASRA